MAQEKIVTQVKKNLKAHSGDVEQQLWKKAQEQKADLTQLTLDETKEERIKKALLALEKDYKNLNNFNHALSVISFGSNIAGLVLIYVIASLNQGGAFRADLKTPMWQVVEVTALVTSALGLIISMLNMYYMEKKKETLRKRTDNILNSLQKVEKNNNEITADDDAEDSKKQKKKLALLELQNILIQTKQSIAPANKLDKLAINFSIVACIIFTVMEVVAVFDVFKPFGLSTVHKAFNLPINIQGLVDSIGIMLILSSSILTIFSKKEALVNNISAENTEIKKRKKINLAIAIPIASAAIVSINLIGKIIQGMQAGESLIIGKTEQGTLPLSFLIRTAALIVSMGITIFNIIGNSKNTKVEEVRIKEAISNYEVFCGKDAKTWESKEVRRDNRTQIYTQVEL